LTYSGCTFFFQKMIQMVAQWPVRRIADLTSAWICWGITYAVVKMATPWPLVAFILASKVRTELNINIMWFVLFFSNLSIELIETTREVPSTPELAETTTENSDNPTTTAPNETDNCPDIAIYTKLTGAHLKVTCESLQPSLKVRWYNSSTGKEITSSDSRWGRIFQYTIGYIIYIICLWQFHYHRPRDHQSDINPKKLQPQFGGQILVHGSFHLFW
jgi:hypothetical protein